MSHRLGCGLLLLGWLLAGASAPAQTDAERRELLRLDKQRVALEQKGNFKGAVRVSKRLLVLSRRVLGERHLVTALVMNNLGILYVKEGQYARAEPLFRRSLAIRKAKLPRDHLDLAHSLHNLANMYAKEGQYARAEPLFRRSLAIREAKLPRDHLDLAHSLNNLASIYWAMGQPVKAEPLFQRSLAIREAKLGKDHPDVAYSLHSLALLYANKGESAKAERLYRRSLAILEAKLGKDHLAVAASLHNLANLYYAVGQYARAEPLYQRSLAIRETKLGKDHPDVAGSLNNLAELYRAMGQSANAEPLYQRSLAIYEAKLGKDHLDLANPLNNLALLYDAMGEYARAEPLFQRSLAIREAKLGKDHPDVAHSLHNLAILYANKGESAKAERLYRHSLAILEAKLGKNHPNVATSLNNLANLHMNLGEYAKAEPLFQRSLAIREANLPKDHPDVASSLNNLALLYAKMHQYARAEPLYRRSLAIREAKLGKNHPAVADSLHNLANLYYAVGQYARAEPLYRSCLAIQEAKLGKDHPDLADSLMNLANLYKDLGQYAKAEPLYRRGLVIKEAKQGKNHPDVALALNNLATLYSEMGQDGKAEPLFQRSLAIFEANRGKNHPTAARVLNNLALLNVRTGRIGQAASYFDRARRSSRKRAARVLPGLSEPEQARFLKAAEEWNFHWALSLGRAHAEQAELAALSASWLANGKGVAQEVLASSALLARDSASPTAGSAARRLLAVRQELARLTFASPRPGQEKQRLERLEDLAAEEAELGKQLRRAGSAAASADWVELEQLRRALPRDGVLIDIARFSVYDFKASRGKRWQPAHYVAWVTAAEGPVRLIDLGPAEKIDAAVAALRRALAEAPKKIRERGEPAADKVLRESLQAVAKLVLQPLLAHAGKSKRWLLSPDGALWLVPFEALPLPDGTYAVERHTIAYLSSGRDLLPGAATRKARSSPLVLADPDFDAGAARPAARRAGGKLPPRSVRLPLRSTRPAGLRLRSAALRLGRVPRLPGTAAEARAIVPAIQGYTGQTPLLHTGRQAREEVFKAVRGPRVVVLATHGFFLPAQRVKHEEATREPEGRRTAPAGWENPLLRCGLLLAGCNKAGKLTSGDDGVLTGLEVVGTDLRGTELVVLSACETGLGEVQSGEGVAGLRQAFQLAGAKAVVSTLWQVPDKQSAQLMALFFRNLSKGMTKAEALRSAKLQVIAERREDFAAAHPFFWAAFTLTGQH
jgi:tetratricopeptide (TPR) repeat protein/CHAT domain-containing protein